jgi:hypothetical protein
MISGGEDKNLTGKYEKEKERKEHAEVGGLGTGRGRTED